MNLRVQDVASGEIRTTTKVEGTGDAAIFSMVDELSQHVRSALSRSSSLEPAATMHLSFANYSTSSLEAYRYYVEGHKLMQQDKYSEAVLLYKRASEEDPEWGRAVEAVSMMYSNIGVEKQSLEYAKRVYELSDRLDPKERHAIEGWYYAKREDTYWQAIQAYRKHVELGNEIIANHIIARRLFLLERVDEAIEQLGSHHRG